MTRIDKETVLAALRAEDVAEHLGIMPRSEQRWRGRWLRTRRCARTDHGSEAFGLAHDGMWHCFGCDEGGDLLALIAAAENIDIRQDFGRVLEVAAGIAGVEPEEVDMFAEPAAPRPARPPAPALPSAGQREHEARKRAAWVWDHMQTDSMIPQAYLRSRGLNPDIILQRETIRATPVRMTKPADDASEAAQTIWRTMGPRVNTLGIAVAVHSVIDGAPVDVRVRRCEPRDGQPKIIGMAGGLVSLPADRGRARRLVGCYGNPYIVDSDLVVICEGLFDYLTALQVWPNAHVLGGVEAGTVSLVAGHAARELAARGFGRMIIVEQNDPPRVRKDGTTIPGAADASINEDPNSATKVAVRHLGPGRVGWLFCEPYKDLNDMFVAGVEPAARVVWWADVGNQQESM